MALEKQMELFEDGGLLQEGGTVDEASGNEVPVGSLKEEVRDDIPAQLSEGEFVMPADVVRYHGLDKMMALRDEAKAGLQRMNDMGQMGNAEEAIIPDDIPFGMEDLDLEDEAPMEMQVGGFVQPQFTQGSLQQSQFAGYQPQYTPYQMPTYPQTPVAGYQPAQQAATPMAPTAVPQFGQFVTPTYVTYVNDAGNTIQIPVGPDGQPLIPVPAGFRKQTETPTTPEAVTPPTTTTQPITQPTGDDSMSPEEAARQQQIQKDISERKAAAKQLGYTKQVGDLEGLLTALIPGAALFGMGKQEAGTIMPDGTIADGKGNTFDPRTGQQVGGKGFLGLGKEDFPTTETAATFGVTPASQAGLMSIPGEESIKQAIAEAEPAPTTPTDVGVESAQTLVEEGATVTDVVREKARELKDSMANLQLSDNQKIDYLVNVANSTKGRKSVVTFPTADNIVGASVDFGKFSDEAREAARKVLDAVGTRGTDELKQRVADATAKLPSRVAAQQVIDTLAKTKPARPTGFRTTETAKERMERTGEGMPRNEAIFRGDAAQDLVASAKSQDPSQYARDVRAGKYDTEFAAMDRAREERNLQRNTGSNKVGTDIRGTYGDDVAKRVRDDQGTVSRVNTETGQISYDSSHDWSKPTQTNANRVTSTKGEETASSRGDKIVCTAMNDAYGFGAFRQTVWLQQSKNLDPAYQKGYHRIFKPLLKVAYGNTKWYNKLLRSTLEGIARRRTADIWLQKKGKRHPIGAVERAILEPICYIVGKIK